MAQSLRYNRFCKWPSILRGENRVSADYSCSSWGSFVLSIPLFHRAGSSARSRARAWLSTSSSCLHHRHWLQLPKTNTEQIAAIFESCVWCMAPSISSNINRLTCHFMPNINGSWQSPLVIMKSQQRMMNWSRLWKDWKELHISQCCFRACFFSIKVKYILTTTINDAWSRDCYIIHYY